LEAIHPDLAAEWHPTKNGDLKPTDVVSGSGKKVWWKCLKCPHEWKTVVSSRACGLKTGCPACSGKVATPSNNLAVKRPDLAAEWHPTKNGDLKPTDVTPGSSKRVWWRCKEGHEWCVAVGGRGGCRKCWNVKRGRSSTPDKNLAREYPELVKEWHPTNDLKPTDFVSGSNKKVWWKCLKCPYEWEGSIRSRTVQGVGCHSCSGKVATPWRNLGTEHPDWAVEWHPTKNGDLKPADVVSGSGKKVWWKCSRCLREWRVSPSKRRGCRSCVRRLLLDAKKRSESLAVKNPEVAKDWHPTKNEDLKPTDIRPGSTKKVWWICPEGHEWETTPSSRVYQRSGCHTCSRRVVTTDNDITVTHPELVKKWHPKNDLKPTDVVSGSGKKVWWKCSRCPYEWESPICYVTRAKREICDACAGRIPVPWRNLATEYPELVKEWHPTKNGGLKSTDVHSADKRKVWWKCLKCPHEWSAQIYHRKNGSGCPACAGRVATPWRNLETEYPELAAEWHPTKNGDLKPTDVTPRSSRKVWWKCSKCLYEREISPSSITNNNKKNDPSYNGCPACSGRVATPWRNLVTEQPYLAKQWHPTKNGDLRPTDVTPLTNKKVWWKCDKCPYEWEAPPARILKNNKKNDPSYNGCPACGGRVATPWRNLATEQPELAKEWHKDNGLKPTDVTPGSSRKVWWICGRCSNEWPATIANRVGRGSGCPVCARNVKLPPMKKAVRGLFRIFITGGGMYDSPGKEQVGEMLMDEYTRHGLEELELLSLPGKGRELRQLTENGFRVGCDSIGVEWKKASVLQGLMKALYLTGRIPFVMPIVRGDVDNILLDDGYLPEFSAVHLDYNSPLMRRHVLATEAALVGNPDAIVAVTVSQVNLHGLQMSYRPGDFPFVNADDPELLFYQPYLGAKSRVFPSGHPMETYCFRGG
jgi:hypothetical protein